MKNTRLVLDNNILLDYFEHREPYYENARLLALLGNIKEAELWVSSNMITDLHYVMRKRLGSEEAQAKLLKSLDFFNICSVTDEDVVLALKRSWNDLEDCLVAICAEKLKADYIVTRDLTGYSRSAVKAITPSELFAFFKTQGITYAELDFSK